MQNSELVRHLENTLAYLDRIPFYKKETRRWIGTEEGTWHQWTEIWAWNKFTFKQNFQNILMLTMTQTKLVCLLSAIFSALSDICWYRYT